MVARSSRVSPGGRAYAAGAPISSRRNGGKEGAGGGFRFPPPCTHPLKRPIRGELRLPPIGCTPRSCPTGSIPAEGAYVVTPPSARGGRPQVAPTWGATTRRAVSKPHQPPWYFNGMAPTAGGDARLVLAGQLQPAAAMNPRTGGSWWAKPPALSFPPLSFGKKAVPRPSRRRRGRFR